MTSRILLISDIHANFPALEAVAAHCRLKTFDMVINCGDTIVYAPFPNETIEWLRDRKALSILGNTDRKILKLLRGEEMKKPKKQEKRVMYTWTSEHLSPRSKEYLAQLRRMASYGCEGFRIGIFHGSPEGDDEFLFPDTPMVRFREIAEENDYDIILSGHSHTPFHKTIGTTHFINPGSVGRMFDGNPQASYGVIELSPGKLRIELRRCPYDIERVVRGLRENSLPSIYEEMYRTGRKLN